MGIQRDIGLAIASDVNVLISGGDAHARTSLACLIHQRNDRGGGSFTVFSPRGEFGTAGTRELIRASSGGTLFIEDLAALDADTQRELRRIVDARVSGTPSAAPRRVITATGEGVLGRLATDPFLADLFYRLNSIHLILQPHRVPRREWVM